MLSTQAAGCLGPSVDVQLANPAIVHLIGGRREGDLRPLGQGALGEADLAEVEEQADIPVGAPADWVVSQ